MGLCINCDDTCGNSRKFCSHKCQRDFEYKENVAAWLEGRLVGWKGQNRSLKNFVRKWLHQTRGTACEVCFWDEKHPLDGAVLTEIDHIDGDAENCVPSNLRILCPNCHAKTSTHRARNKASSRKGRLTRYYEGKSY